MVKNRKNTLRKGLRLRHTRRRKSVRRKRTVRRKSVRRKSVRRKSVRRKRIQVGGGGPNWNELKSSAESILTGQYSDAYIVGSMAIALHEEANNPLPNDIDIVLPVNNGNLGQVPGIEGMTSENQTATSGATFHGNVGTDYEGLSVDVIQSAGVLPTIDTFGDLRVLNVASLKSRYQEILTAWESNATDKKIAKQKLVRLNALPNGTQDREQEPSDEEQPSDKEHSDDNQSVRTKLF